MFRQEERVLDVLSVGKAYPAADGTRRVLQDVTLSVATSELVVVMGDSGVGKTTLLNLIAGIDQPDSGSVRLDGDALESMDERARTLLRRRKLGFVFQAFHLLPYLSVADNIRLPLLLNGEDSDAAHARVQSLLDSVGLSGRGTDWPSRLSGGQMQRVAIARALAHRPRLVLADEPTGNLDPTTATSVLALLRKQLKQDGASAVIVTHSEATAAMGDRVLRLTLGGLEPVR